MGAVLKSYSTQPTESQLPSDNVKSEEVVNPRESSRVNMAADEEEVPYWRDYEANAIRGVLAAVGCAVLFALLAVVYKFRWRGNGDKEGKYDQGRGRVTYNREADAVNGIDNQAMDS